MRIYHHHHQKVQHGTVYQLWEWAGHTHAMGDIISPEI